MLLCGVAVMFTCLWNAGSCLICSCNSSAEIEAVAPTVDWTFWAPATGMFRVNVSESEP